MKTPSNSVLFVILVAALVGAASATNYLWLTDDETSRFGDRIMFFNGDTLDGPVHSNDTIAIMQSPVFYDVVSTTAPDFWHGRSYNPIFLGPPPVFNAPRVDIPDHTGALRAAAVAQGHFYSDPPATMMVNLRGTYATIWRWTRGTLMDSTVSWTIPFIGETCIFFDCPIRIRGLVQGHAFIGCSGDMGIEDDIRYVDADSLTGVTPSTSNNYLFLYSERDIKIRNTWANGRQNSGGRGFSQTNPDSTDVVITADLNAPRGSFTFENQNDADSGYVCLPCGCTPDGRSGGPDDRGTVSIYGGITQNQRGLFHRSNCTSTGYLKHLRYDQRLRNFHPFYYVPCASADPDTLDFGNVLADSTAWDTVTVTFDTTLTLGSVYASYPFWATRTPPYYGRHFHIPVRFSPPGVGRYQGHLFVSGRSCHVDVLLLGRGVPPAGPHLVANVSPNPFNSIATLRYVLPEPGPVKIILYDVLGRLARQMDLGSQDAGEHTAILDAFNLASGVYFLRLEAARQTAIQKVLLLK
jgi:hypothetical protein